MLVEGTSMTQGCNTSKPMRVRRSKRLRLVVFTAALAAMALVAPSCSRNGNEGVQAGGPAITVGVTKVVKKSLGRQLTLSSELVPFQEIDVYAKESGLVKELTSIMGRTSRRTR